MNQEIKSALFRVLPFVIILFILILRIRQNKINSKDLDIKRPVSIHGFLLWTIGFFIFILLTEFTFYKFGILELDKWNHSLIPSMIRILGAVILAPIVEEIIFRGLILNVLWKRNINMHLSIFIQACFFVLLHNFTYENSLSSNIGIVQSLIDASLFGYARYYTKSIYTPMTMHMTGNFIATFERFIF